MTRRNIFLIWLLLIISNSPSYSQVLYASSLIGTPVWNNSNNKYLKKSFVGLMGRVLFPTKKGYQMGVSISFNPYEVDENRVLSSINKTTELIERSSTFHTNFRIGSVIMREKKIGRILLVYGCSLGLNLVHKNAFEVIYYPFDTVAVGYSSERIRLYGDGLFSSYGYYIMPTTDLSYKFSFGSKSKDLYFDINLHVGLHCYYGSSIKNNVFESLPNNQSQSNIIKYKEKLSSIGMGFHFGFVSIW